MPYFAGIDEAGYGPNLGPLVISGSLWHIDDPGVGLGDRSADIYHLLGDAVSRVGKTGKSEFAGIAPLCIDDSKLIYKPRGSITILEHGVLTCLRLLHGSPAESWFSLLDQLSPNTRKSIGNTPWDAAHNPTLPLKATRESIAESSQLLSNACANNGVRLIHAQSRVVFPAEFNTGLSIYGNKSSALTYWSLELLHDLLTHCKEEPVFVLCDKHGGRNFYAAPLQHRFPGPLIEIVTEGRAESIYRWGPREQRVEVRFCTGGEEFLPTALASMFCKYLRELAMLGWNNFWQTYVPDLRPTAGYPQDAKRYKLQIESTQQTLGIDDTMLWRVK